MADDRIDAWLQEQVGLNPREIELGLDRVVDVWRKLGAPDPAPIKIVVGGTNGKGSCVAFLEAMLLAAGYRVGCYTSPHLHRYAERVRFNGYPADESRLLRALQITAAARRGVPLTYFELGTLSALTMFAAEDLDVAILEVGLGGRLDAVNIVDADLSLVTNVDLDHQGWLGADREAIGIEKAGIFRAGRPGICGDLQPPASLLRFAREHDVDLHVCGQDYIFRTESDCWHWRGRRAEHKSLPCPVLRGRHQIANAAAVLASLEALSDRLPIDQRAIHEGLLTVRLAGRFDVRRLGAVTWVLDVAHNPAAARRLSETLDAQSCGERTFAVLGMLAEKDVAGVVSALGDRVTVWYLAGLADARGLSGEDLRERVQSGAPQVEYEVRPSVESALDDVAAVVRGGDRVVVLGSFVTVGLATTWLESVESDAQGPV